MDEQDAHPPIETSPVLGIDLGTTNSEVAAWAGDRVKVLGPGAAKILPSCVGISATGELLVGEAARNQQLLYPERTVRSIKRRMGRDETVTLGEKTFTPQEVSALILRALGRWAERELGERVRRAVITVPAYFSDAQRQATREAGELAGLEVLRILNEPTAASLAYAAGDGTRRTVLVYDLGGGTFDVSVVRLEGEVTEVLASHGDNHLGGDDFDELLVEHLERAFEERHGVSLHSGGAGTEAVRARLTAAAEEAKKELSVAPYARVREESLVSSLHLELEITRQEYEDMIRPLVTSTLDSVSQALNGAGMRPSELDAVFLVGGSSRTPLVSRLLEEATGLVPRQEVHPDLCVALGAGVLASRLAGRDVERVLVDVSPYSFGISHVGTLDGCAYSHCYKPTLRRNTPLPLTRTESYFTSHTFQREAEIEIFQGEDPDSFRNVPVGHFRVEGLRPTREPNEILCRMSLDLDGILQVAAIEKATGMSKEITVTQALEPKSDAEIAAARARLEAFDEAEGFGFTETDDDGEETVVLAGPGSSAQAGSDSREDDRVWTKAMRQARRLQERSRELLGQMHEDDREEAVQLSQAVEKAIAGNDLRSVTETTADLDEFLFFVEGR